MIDKRCHRCANAEYEQVDTPRGSFWSLCGCKSDPCNSAECFDEEWGETIDCPYFEEDVE